MIGYVLPMRSHVVLSIYNAPGQIAATLVNETEQAGRYSVRFDDAGLASGVYFYLLQGETYVRTLTFVHLK